MERRCFVQKALVTSAGAVAGLAMAPALNAQGRQEPARLRATVLRVTLDEELDRELRGGSGGPCPVFQDGQQFVIDSPYLCPEGFCHWAWADIRTFIQAAYFGSDTPQVACCTDGVRPVFFRIERMGG
jgi:uncharacterized repeat protein (TIGR04076 family)